MWLSRVPEEFEYNFISSAANPHRLMLIHGLDTTWQQSFGAVIDQFIAELEAFLAGPSVRTDR